MDLLHFLLQNCSSMKYVFDIGVFGGQGGAPYSQEEGLNAAGLRLGARPGSSRLSSLHVEAWGSSRVLSHHTATYTCIKEPSRTFTTPGHGNIRADPATDIVIPGDSRVVCASAGGFTWMAGAVCLDFLAIEIAPVGQAGQNSVGSNWSLDGFGQAYIEGGTCPSVDIPDGMTLAGFQGRAGDSWDQVSLLVCPWLPMGGTWDCQVHKHLVAPFKQQVRTLLLCLQQLQASGAVQPLERTCLSSLWRPCLMPPSLVMTSPAHRTVGRPTAHAANRWFLEQPQQHLQQPQPQRQQHSRISSRCGCSSRSRRQEGRAQG